MAEARHGADARARGGEAPGAHREEVSVTGSDVAGGGMGAQISKILARDLAGREPVLAKRRTPLMRELDEARDTKRERRKRRAEEAPAPAAPGGGEDVVREKARRKVATRAVVALFNAIQKHQAPSSAESPPADARPKSKSKKKGGKPASGANDWSRDDFLLEAGGGW
mmetsp:Transcript_10557/g.31758  ORF Transcript_10557/g.31758 Transcript_10557/m.31758 type:complete len:168 (+) Transcript_10557:405-908(+)